MMSASPTTAPSAAVTAPSNTEPTRASPQQQPAQSQMEPQMVAMPTPSVDAVSGSRSVHQEYDAGAGVDEEDEDEDIPGLEDKRVKRGFSKRVTLGDLERYFEYPIEEVSRMMGVSTTIIKRLCRKYGIKRWPYRQIRSVNKSIKYVELLARTAMGPDRQRLQDQLVSLHYKKQLICQAATTGASAKVRKSILQMRPEELDAETLLRSGGAQGERGGLGGGVEAGNGGRSTNGHDDGHDGHDHGEGVGAALEQHAMDVANSAAAAAAAAQNPYGMPPHMSMAGVPMGYSPYVHAAAAAQAHMVLAHHQPTQQQQKPSEGGMTAAAAASAASAGASQMHAYGHLGMYGGYPGMLGMPYAFQAHAYPGMPGYGLQGMGGYPSLASGSSEHLASSIGMNGVQAMQLAAHNMQQQQQQQLHDQQHIDLHQPQEVQLYQQHQQRQQLQQQEAALANAAAADAAAAAASAAAASEAPSPAVEVAGERSNESRKGDIAAEVEGIQQASAEGGEGLSAGPPSLGGAEEGRAQQGNADVRNGEVRTEPAPASASSSAQGDIN